MKKTINLSIIYVYYNTPKELIRSLDSIGDAIKSKGYEIIIVDNNSPKKLPNSIKGSNIKITTNKTNLGFGSGCNLGASKSKGKYLLFINPDTIFKPGSIDQMLGVFKKENKVGVVGPKMLTSKGSVLPTTSTFITPLNSLIKFSFLGKLFTKNVVKEGVTSVLSGACLLIPRIVFEKVGGFDERFFMYFEEQDLCKKIYDKGYKIIYHPESEIVHLVGKSLDDKKIIQSYFQKSRYKYMHKHFGKVKALMVEAVLRVASSTNIVVGLIFLFSLFINTYRINDLMLFIGDTARDFLAGKEMVINGQIPLVGIPSSVTWLHQGPISVWCIGVALALSGLNPIAPGYLFGFIGAISTALLYLLGKTYFSKRVGIISALLFATSPMIVVNSRMPYHTSLIPFFSIIFFLVLFKSTTNKKLLPLVFLLFGLLLQVELSNIVVLGVIVGVLIFLKSKLSKSDIYKTAGGFIIGILPFILYELRHGPSYLLFPLWILNRMRLFVGIGSKTGSTLHTLPSAFETIYQQISSVVFPYIPLVGVIVFVIALISLSVKLRKKATSSVLILFLWIVIPLVAFFLHASPGTAYFGLLYPAISLSIALMLDQPLKRNLVLLSLLVVFCFLNAVILVKNDYYVTTDGGSHPMPPSMYNFGSSWRLSDIIAKAIVDDAKGREFEIKGAGSVAMFATGLDPYTFLIEVRDGNIRNTARLKYIIYQERMLIPVNARVIYGGLGGYVTKNE